MSWTYGDTELKETWKSERRLDPAWLDWSEFGSLGSSEPKWTHEDVKFPFTPLYHKHTPTHWLQSCHADDIKHWGQLWFSSPRTLMNLTYDRRSSKSKQQNPWLALPPEPQLPLKICTFGIPKYITHFWLFHWQFCSDKENELSFSSSCTFVNFTLTSPCPQCIWPHSHLIFINMW